MVLEVRASATVCSVYCSRDKSHSLLENSRSTSQMLQRRTKNIWVRKDVKGVDVEVDSVLQIALFKLVGTGAFQERDGWRDGFCSFFPVTPYQY